MTYEFARPAWLIVLGVVPFWWWWAWPRRKSGLLVGWGEGAGLVAVHRWTAVAIETAPMLLRAVALICLVLALCRPQLVRSYRERVNEDVGIVLAIDLSTSMLAEDMADGTTRLQAAKATIMRFLEKRTDDVGLVVFAGEALTRLPLTHDRSLVKSAVNELGIGLLRDGTDIAGATAAAGGLFRDAPHQSKILILVTDGAHNKPGLEPGQAAQAAAAHGVKIYAIAIGGGKTDDAKMQAMETVLGQTARISGARYFRATDVAALDAIYAEIDDLIASPETSFGERTSVLTVAPWFLLAGAASLVAALALRGSRWGAVP